MQFSHSAQVASVYSVYILLILLLVWDYVYMVPGTYTVYNSYDDRIDITFTAVGIYSISAISAWPVARVDFRIPGPYADPAQPSGVTSSTCSTPPCGCVSSVLVIRSWYRLGPTTMGRIGGLVPIMTPLCSVFSSVGEHCCWSQLCMHLQSCSRDTQTLRACAHAMPLCAPTTITTPAAQLPRIARHGCGLLTRQMRPETGAVLMLICAASQSWRASSILQVFTTSLSSRPLSAGTCSSTRTILSQTPQKIAACAARCHLLHPHPCPLAAALLLPSIPQQHHLCCPPLVPAYLPDTSVPAHLPLPSAALRATRDSA